MRFLITFVAVLGYASAGAIAPLAYGANAGDVQAAVIDATVAAQDHARAIGESQARAAEAVRQVAETNRDLHVDAYWKNVAASQNYVAAAQSQAAALNGAAQAFRAAHLAGPAYAPLTYAGLNAYGYGPYGLGLHAW